MELHAVEFEQQIVGELDVGLVDLVDEQHRLPFRFEGFPQLAADDVVGDVVHLRVAELRVAQSRHGVVLVESLLRARGRLDVPGEQRPIQRPRHLLGETGLAGAGLALDEQRPFEGDGGVDRHHEVVGRDIGVGAGESLLRHAASLGCGGGYAGAARLFYPPPRFHVGPCGRLHERPGIGPGTRRHGRSR